MWERCSKDYTALIYKITGTVVDPPIRFFFSNVMKLFVVSLRYKELLSPQFTNRIVENVTNIAATVNSTDRKKPSQE
jgi:hypothetical protein